MPVRPMTKAEILAAVRTIMASNNATVKRALKATLAVYLRVLRAKP